MPELSMKVSEAGNTQAGTPEAAAHSPSNKKSGSEINLDEIPIDDNADPRGIIGGATKDDSRTAEASRIFIGDVTATEDEVFFVTGSSYKGSWDALGMAGAGRYVMPNGAVYEGEMRDGMFHGHGSLYWSEYGRLDVVHLRGVLQEQRRYTFSDGLAYRDADWSYCRFPDRRFHESIKRGLRPGGRALKTAKQPTKLLPPGCYDCGDGVFDPKKLTVTSYDDSTKVLRTPSMQECDWIVKNCRKSWSEPTGYRSSLNENWSENPPDLPYNLAMSEDSPDPWWKRLTSFARDVMDDGQVDDSRSSNEHFELPELCLCGQYVILGEPCHCPPASESSENEWHDDSDGASFYNEETRIHLDDNRVECEDVYAESDRVSYADNLSEDAIDERKIEGDKSLPSCVNETDLSADNEFPEDSTSEKFVENYKELAKNSEDEIDDGQLDLTAANIRSEDVLWPSRKNSSIENTESVTALNDRSVIEEKLTVTIEKSEDALEIRRRSSKVNAQNNSDKLYLMN